MSWLEDTKFRLQFFFIAMLFIGPGFMIWTAGETKQRIESLSWPAVEGVVERVDAKPWIDSKGNQRYYGRATYRYEVSGQEYVSDLTDLGPGEKRASVDAALADVWKYEPGMKVSVYCDPAKPEIGVLEPGFPPTQLGLLVVLIVGTVIGFIVTACTVWAWFGPKKVVAIEASDGGGL